MNPLPPMSVAKFGGTSVGTLDAMQRSADVIEQNPHTRLVVISACAGVTNHLVALAQGVNDPQARQDKLAAITAIHQAILTQLPACQDTQVAVDHWHHAMTGACKHRGLYPQLGVNGCVGRLW